MAVTRKQFQELVIKLVGRDADVHKALVTIDCQHQTGEGGMHSTKTKSLIGPGKKAGTTVNALFAKGLTARQWKDMKAVKVVIISHNPHCSAVLITCERNDPKAAPEHLTVTPCG